MAGRSTPGSIFNTKCAIAIKAPVVAGADTGVGFVRFDEIQEARRIEEFFLRRSASRG